MSDNILEQMEENADADRFRLLAEDRLSVSDRDLFQAVYNESVSGFLRWKMKRWMAKRK